MKTFHVKQKMWSLGGRFTISDDLGIPTYQVEGSFFQVPKTFIITDMQGQLVSRVEKRFLTFLPVFDVQLANGSRFTLHKELTFFKPRYQIENLGLTVQGNFWNMDFELSQNEQPIARISQEWMRLTSTYVVTIYDEHYTDLVISLVIAIDYVKETESGSANNS